MKQGKSIISVDPTEAQPPAALEDAADAGPEAELRPFVIAAADHGARLDRALVALAPEFSRSYLQQLIEAGAVTLNSATVARCAHKVRAGDQGTIELRPTPQSQSFRAEAMDLKVVFEDEHLLVIDKPAGMVVHPATSGHMTGTLVNAVLGHVPLLEGIGGERRPGIVHRLDKGTSGLIVVAKHDRAMRALQAQFKARQVHKVYLALVDGAVEPARGRIEIPIDRDPRQRQRMAAVAGGRPAVTLYRTLETFGGAHAYTLLACEPRTGRTHQIRVHLAALGTPIVGDATYRRHKTPLELDRPFLHAHRLGFKHPSTGEPVEFEAPLPHELEEVLAGLRRRAVGNRQ